jgi:hypothetical protein
MADIQNIIDAKEEKKVSIVDMFNEYKDSSTEDKKKVISDMDDETLDELLKDLTIYDEEGRTYVFPSEDEAIIFSAALQQNVPQIRFCKINKCFSLRGGIFWIVEPVATEYAEKMTELELKTTNNDIVVPNEIIFLLIIERSKRNKERQENIKE